jgi:hypothetical protein
LVIQVWLSATPCCRQYRALVLPEGAPERTQSAVWCLPHRMLEPGSFLAPEPVRKSRELLLPAPERVLAQPEPGSERNLCPDEARFLLALIVV